MECVPSDVHGGDLSSSPTAHLPGLLWTCAQRARRREKGAGTRQWAQRHHGSRNGSLISSDLVVVYVTSAHLMMSHI